MNSLMHPEVLCVGALHTLAYSGNACWCGQMEARCLGRGEWGRPVWGWWKVP